MATFIKKDCDCCPPTVCEGCSTPCNLFPATSYQSYFDEPGILPTGIYLGGTRQFGQMDFPSPWPGADPQLNVQIWQGVSGGTLVSKSGTSYGDTTNGVILEPIDPDNLSAGYAWAVYKNSVRSTATFLIDGVNRHDNFPATFEVYSSAEYGQDCIDYSPSDLTFTIYRTGCLSWSRRLRVGTHWYDDFKYNSGGSNPCDDCSLSYSGNFPITCAPDYFLTLPADRYQSFPTSFSVSSQDGINYLISANISYAHRLSYWFECSEGQFSDGILINNHLILYEYSLTYKSGSWSCLNGGFPDCCLSIS